MLALHMGLSEIIKAYFPVRYREPLGKYDRAKERKNIEPFLPCSICIEFMRWPPRLMLKTYGDILYRIADPETGRYGERTRQKHPTKGREQWS